MLSTSNTHYPYEHYGDISVDFGSDYWEKLIKKHIDTSNFKAQGFEFTINNEGKFFFSVWVTPLNSSLNEKGEVPVKKITTDITWEEFSKSFVRLRAQAFWGRQGFDKFYELEGDE